MVRCHRIDTACTDCIPQGILALLTFHRRRTYKVPAILAFVDLTCKLQILRTGLNINFVAFPFGSNGSLEPFLVSHMYDIERCLKVFGPVDRSFIGFRFYKFRTAQVVIPGRGFPLRLEFCDVQINHVGIFGMNIDNRTDFFAPCQNPGKSTVIHHKAFFFIYKKTFEACNSFRHG